MEPLGKRWILMMKQNNKLTRDWYSEILKEEPCITLSPFSKKVL
jgi:hypothetical protein